MSIQKKLLLHKTGMTLLGYIYVKSVVLDGIRYYADEEGLNCFIKPVYKDNDFNCIT